MRTVVSWVFRSDDRRFAAAAALLVSGAVVEGAFGDDSDYSGLLALVLFALAIWAAPLQRLATLTAGTGPRAATSTLVGFALVVDAVFIADGQSILQQLVGAVGVALLLGVVVRVQMTAGEQ